MLITIRAYMVQVFVKVVVLVVFLGLTHGLFILPVVFAALPLDKLQRPPKSAEITTVSIPPISISKDQLEKRDSIAPRFDNSRG